MSILKRLFGRSENVTFRRTQRQDNGYTYDVYTAASHADAIAFLRRHEVKEENRYAIVETPQGNLGKEFIMIFEEGPGTFVEFGERKPLKKSIKSRTHCSRCGYPVIPLSTTSAVEPFVGSTTDFVVPSGNSEMKEKGFGYDCSHCNRLCCAICASLEDSPQCSFCNNQLKMFF